jgi:hypothetical protein
MRYMLIMNTPRDGYAQYMKWPKKILEANAAFMQAFTKKLSDAGELVATEGLAAPEQAKRVRAGKDGKLITDGAFAESKEFLAGFWIVDVDSPERALEIAGEARRRAPPSQRLTAPRSSTSGSRSVRFSEDGRISDRCRRRRPTATSNPYCAIWRRRFSAPWSGNFTISPRRRMPFRKR